MTLEELAPWLYARTTGGIRWGLERTQALLAGVGDPHRQFSSILIGGTNGKGSVAAFCDAGLRTAGGRRIGLYTSPHLVSFNERVRIDGVPVAGETLASAALRLRPAIEESGASFFEATTAIAFLLFAEAGVEVAVVEVGLGGRLDATNVVEPLVAAVTNVSRDHADYLGEELHGIAREKGGIFRTGAPAVTAELDPGVLAVLRECAAATSGSFRSLEELVSLGDVTVSAAGTDLIVDSLRWGRRRLRLGLIGRHQARNGALAAEVLGLLPAELRPSWDAIAEGFAATRWPGRLQVERIRGTTWVFDVAHNAEGARVLADALDALELPRPHVLVAGVLADKEWRSILAPLVARASAAVITVPDSAPAARRWDPAAAAEWVRAEMNGPVRTIREMSAALERAATLAPHGTVIVTGSVHTVGDALQHLQLPSY